MGCPSFGPVPIACAGDEHCPPQMRCGIEGVCIPGTSSGTSSGVDAGADAGGASIGFCETRQPAPFFCDDFDDGGLDGRWTSSGPQNASLVVDDQVSLSAPASLLARVNIGVTEPAVDVSIVAASGASYSRRTVRTDVRVEALDPAGHRAVILRNTIGSEGVYIALYDNGSELYEHRTQSVPQIQLPSLPLNAWTTVELELVVAPPSSRVTVRYAGLEVLKDHLLGLTSGPTAEPEASAGLYVNGTTTAETRVRFDNVVFELAP